MEINKDQPQETKKRKVVQIAASGESPDQALFALCNDGNIFVNYNTNGWEKLPDIPQD